MILSNYREVRHNFEIFKSVHEIPPFLKELKKMNDIFEEH